MKQIGTEKHEIACKLISMKINLPRTRATLNMYVNDAIGFRMHPETVLYFSPYCFGTADAIAFDEKKKFLRIHDLKTGVIPASMDQLKVYAALFCLEYGYDPRSLTYELRIYQNDDILIENPDPQEIIDISKKIVEFTKVLEERSMSNE